MRELLQRYWKIIVPVGVIGTAVVAWLAFGVFGIQTLFTDDEVNEAPPEFASGAGPSGLPSDETTVEMAAAMNETMVEESTPSEALVDESAPMEETADAPEVLTLAEGDFVDRAHPGDGRAFVLSDGNQSFLRFEDFETDNGPDLNVYLSTAPADAPADQFDDDFIDLGDLKGNIGPQNYELPADVDLERYRTVVVWCVRFSVAFTAADLAPAA